MDIKYVPVGKTFSAKCPACKSCSLYTHSVSNAGGTQYTLAGSSSRSSSSPHWHAASWWRAGMPAQSQSMPADQLSHVVPRKAAKQAQWVSFQEQGECRFSYFVSWMRRTLLSDQTKALKARRWAKCHPWQRKKEKENSENSHCFYCQNEPEKCFLTSGKVTRVSQESLCESSKAKRYINTTEDQDFPKTFSSPFVYQCVTSHLVPMAASRPLPSSFPWHWRSNSGVKVLLGKTAQEKGKKNQISQRNNAFT